jgi:hypothetical protein
LKNKRLLAIRKQREAWAEDKWIQARRIANILTIIPTITLVGVTGGLTRSNTRQEDDIDFIIISSPEALWVTRALSTVLLDILRLRRRVNDREVRNRICLNMFISEAGLAVPRTERDLYTAHEVLLMTPLWERGGAYQKFLTANRWVKKFLPNAWKKKNQELRIRNHGQKQNIGVFFRLPLIHVSRFLIRLIEPVAQYIQLRYMSRRRSSEIVTDIIIRFHPRDARIWIKRALGRRLAKYDIPLDKIFYAR